MSSLKETLLDEGVLKGLMLAGIFIAIYGFSYYINGFNLTVIFALGHIMSEICIKKGEK
jgi:hypothetical protein